MEQNQSNYSLMSKQEKDINTTSNQFILSQEERNIIALQQIMEQVEQKLGRMEKEDQKEAGPLRNYHLNSNQEFDQKNQQIEGIDMEQLDQEKNKFNDLIQGDDDAITILEKSIQFGNDNPNSSFAKFLTLPPSSFINYKFKILE